MQRVHLSGEFLVHGTTHAFCCTEAVYLTVPAPDPAEHPIADDRNWKHSQGAKSTELSKIETLCLGRANLLKKFRTSSQKLEAIANAQQSVLQIVTCRILWEPLYQILQLRCQTQLLFCYQLCVFGVLALQSINTPRHETQLMPCAQCVVCAVGCVSPSKSAQEK
jgi:hypothetical protein